VKLFLRIVGVMLALVMMVGFGACRVLGLMIGAGNSPDTGFVPILIVLGAIGVAIAIMIAWRLYLRLAASGETPAPPPPGQ
jgi:hypothetical protein